MSLRCGMCLWGSAVWGFARDAGGRLGALSAEFYEKSYSCWSLDCWGLGFRVLHGVTKDLYREPPESPRTRAKEGPYEVEEPSEYNNMRRILLKAPRFEAPFASGCSLLGTRNIPKHPQPIPSRTTNLRKPALP